MARRKRKKSENAISLKGKIYLCLFSCIAVFLLYFLTFKSNVDINHDECFIYISEIDRGQNIFHALSQKEVLKSNVSFWITSRIAGLDSISEGLYKLKKGWGNLAIINALKKRPARNSLIYSIPEIRSRDHLVRRICKDTKTDLKTFQNVVQDSLYLNENFGLDKESVYCIFIPGNYRIYEGSDAKELLANVYSYYSLFWNDERLKQAKKINRSPEDVIKLASIVYAETKNTQEMPVIAGIYLNRLEKNMRLEADPTLVYAKGNWGIKRVYFKYASINSKYNTYRYKGLPPGPIGPAPIKAIESVLNPEEHNYLFFCAKDDFSGCHVFTENYDEHKKNAQKYRFKLNKNKGK